MSLSAIIADVEDATKTLRVCNFDGDAATLDRIFDHVGVHNVDVERDRTDSGAPAGFLLLESDGTVVAGESVELVYEYVTRWENGDVSLDTTEFTTQPAILDHLDDSFFRSYGKRRMILASRSVEEKAWSVGSGQLYAGFQHLSKVRTQWGVYRRLAETPVDVRIYGLPDWNPPEGTRLETYGVDSDEVATHWWVVYDGDGDDTEKAALLAQERADNEFYGFWTYRSAVVDRLVDYFESSYPTV